MLPLIPQATHLLQIVQGVRVGEDISLSPKSCETEDSSAYICVLVHLAPYQGG